MTTRRPLAPAWFLVPLAAVYAAAMVVLTALPRLEAPGVLAGALTIDLVVLVPAAWWIVLVRGRRWPLASLVPVVLASFGAASLLVPDEHHGLLDVLVYALPMLELAAVGYVGSKAVRMVRGSRAGRAFGLDFHDALRAAAREVLGHRAVADALAFEVALIHHAFTLRPGAAVPNGFSYHRRSGYGAVLFALLMAAGAELVGVHFLLRLWSEVAAVVHLVLGAYAVVWLVGDYRAMSRRPHVLDDTGLRLRCGLRWDLSVPWSQVAAVRRNAGALDKDGLLETAPIGSPRWVVELRAPAVASGPYGLTREVTRVGLVVDDDVGFTARLAEVGVAVG